VSASARVCNVSAISADFCIDPLGDVAAALAEHASGLKGVSGEAVGERLTRASRPLSIFSAIASSEALSSRRRWPRARRRIEARGDQRREILIALGQALIKRAAAFDDRLLDREQLAVDEGG